MMCYSFITVNSLSQKQQVRWYGAIWMVPGGKLLSWERNKTCCGREIISFEALRETLHDHTAPSLVILLSRHSRVFYSSRMKVKLCFSMPERATAPQHRTWRRGQSARSFSGVELIYYYMFLHHGPACLWLFLCRKVWEIPKTTLSAWL